MQKSASETSQIDEQIMGRVEEIFQSYDRDDDQVLSIEEIMPFFK